MNACPRLDVILVVILSLGRPDVFAQGHIGKIKTKKAQAYLDLATSLFRARYFEGALVKSQRAEPLVRGGVQPLIRFNIARCFEELDRHVEALRAYRRYLELGEDVPRRRQRALAVIQRIRQRHVGYLVVRCAPSSVVTRII